MRAPRPLRTGLGDRPRLGLLLRGLAERYALAGLLLLSLALVILGKADIKAVRWLTARAGDLAAPVLAAVQEPVMTVRDAADGQAARLAVENEALRELARMPRVEAAPLWTTARVVADPGGPFVRTLLIDAGADRGIENGMAVVDETGLVGRIVSVGQRSARVLLVTDLNSKIPVVTERSRDQAVLEGTNDRRPELRFAPMDPSFRAGDRVLTSGRGGVLPPGLLIGEIDEIRDQRIIVRPYVDWARLDYVAVLKRLPTLPPEADQPAAPGPAVAAAPAPAAGAR
jgi:rod shape-determining protein MreC